MRVECINGYFKLFENAPGQASDFAILFGFDLVPKDDYFTFSTIEDAPKFSISGSTYLDNDAIKTFEGEPWEVMLENKLVYDPSNDVVVPISSIKQRLTIQATDRYFIADGLIIPGSMDSTGQVVLGYTCWFSRDSMQFKYSQVNYV